MLSWVTWKAPAFFDRFSGIVRASCAVVIGLAMAIGLAWLGNRAFGALFPAVYHAANPAEYAKAVAELPVWAHALQPAKIGVCALAGASVALWIAGGGRRAAWIVVGALILMSLLAALNSPAPQTGAALAASIAAVGLSLLAGWLATRLFAAR